MPTSAATRTRGGGRAARGRSTTPPPAPVAAAVAEDLLTEEQLDEKIQKLLIPIVTQIWEAMTDPRCAPLLANGCDFQENNVKCTNTRLLLSHEAACQKLDQNTTKMNILCQELLDIMTEHRDGLTLDNQGDKMDKCHKKLDKFQADHPNFVNLHTPPNDDQFLAFAQPTNGWHLVPVPFDNGARHFFVHNCKIKMWRELAQPAVVTGIAKRNHQTFNNSKVHLNNCFLCNHVAVFDCIVVKGGSAVPRANTNANNMEQVVESAVARAVPAAVQTAVPAAVQTAVQQELQPALAQLKDDRDPEILQSLLSRLEAMQNAVSEDRVRNKELQALLPTLQAMTQQLQDREQNVELQALLPTLQEMVQRLQASGNDGDDTVSEQLAAISTEMQRLAEGVANLRTAEEGSEDEGVGMGEGTVSDDEEGMEHLETKMVERKTARVMTVLDNPPADDKSVGGDSC